MVQTIYDIIKAHGEELRVETKEGGRCGVYHSFTTKGKLIIAYLYK